MTPTITYLKKDITSIDFGIVAHGCNCQFKMGSGVAGAIRSAWPLAYEEYMKLKPLYPDTRELLGRAQYIKIYDGLWVANLFTQEFYGKDNKKYADELAIYDALKSTLELAKNMELPVYIPPIGSGLGGLDWDTEVYPLVSRAVNETGVSITVCEI